MEVQRHDPRELLKQLGYPFSLIGHTVIRKLRGHGFLQRLSFVAGHFGSSTARLLSFP
jgi:hypothetical protein